MMHWVLQPIVFLFLAAVLAWLGSPSAAAQQPQPAGAGSASASPATKQPALTAAECDRCGKVESIRQVSSKDQWTPLGTVAPPSDLGPSGIAVYQIGPGFSNQGQAFVGAAGGGAYQTRANKRDVTRWEVVVKMDDGSGRSVIQNYEPLFVVGDRVHVFGTQVELLQ
jgi:outer membrane lipoprotein SlyB